MPKGGKKKGKPTGKVDKVKRNPLFEKRPRSFRIGGDLRPKRDVTRFVRWPRYVLLQRQKRILLKRLKVPPAINQFTRTLDKNGAQNLFKLLKKYQPESRVEKRQRLLNQAKAKVDNTKGKDAKNKPLNIKFGLNHVTTLVENKKAKLVVIAHDVDPIELVIWLPQLCRKQEVPFCFVKNKERLGTLVHQKQATCLALTEVRKEDQNELEALAKSFRASYNESTDLRRNWGGGERGLKSQHQEEAKIKLREKEELKKAGL